MRQECKDQSLTYTLKKVRRSKSLRLTIHQDGRVVVTAPFYVSFKQMQAFYEERRNWVWEKIRALEIVEPPRAAAEYKRYKEEARTLILERLEYFNRFYGFQYNRISIRDTRTRWGSCSEHGNLNFSYKLFFLPPALADYIIVHELCHLKELNHALAFWDLVALAMPDFKERRRELKRLRV